MIIIIITIVITIIIITINSIQQNPEQSQISITTHLQYLSEFYTSLVFVWLHFFEMFFFCAARLGFKIP